MSAPFQANGPKPHFTAGLKGLPKTRLTAPDGSQAEVYLHGAQVTSWIPAGGSERLFLSRTAQFGPDSAIRGGVPVVFPQFSNLGPLRSHGFARRMDWGLTSVKMGSQDTWALFQLKGNEDTLRQWPHAFLADLRVTVGGGQLELAFSVQNVGEQEFSFTCALHTYLRAGDIHDVVIERLGGLTYLDDLANRERKTQPEGALTFTGEVDRIYLDAPEQLVIHEKKSTLWVEKPGFPDAVVWNPWAERGAALPDLEPEGYLHMFCIEPAVIARPVVLAPGESWTGVQRLIS